MTPRAIRHAAASVIALWAVALSPPVRAAGDATGDAVSRGAYLFTAAGCYGCHTDEKNQGVPLTGGRRLGTPFGDFYTPNITPDVKTGIGGWSETDFVVAMRTGTGPKGKPLFPAFPYTSYAKISDGDLKDLFAYLQSLPPVEKANRDHNLSAPYGWRFTLPVWQGLFGPNPGPVADNPGKSAEWNRGRYLVDALGHCGECHTPRNPLGAMEPVRYLAGNAQGADGDGVPGLTPRARKFAKWSVGDVETFLESGMAPDGDFVGSTMAEVVNNTTSKLTKADRRAMAVYLKDLPVR